MWVPLLMLSSTLDPAAITDHAAKLAALGPHPLGSARSAFAAAFVATRFRAVGLADVRVQPFGEGTSRGENVLAVLPGSSKEFIVLAAHHDTPPDSSAAADGAAVGVVVETARVLAREPSRPRTIVFASLDGEKSAGHAGSKALLSSLDTRELVAALVLDRCGTPEGVPQFRVVPATDSRGTARYPPLWLVTALRRGPSGSPLVVGGPRLFWLEQPSLRTFRVPPGPDASFLREGLPALTLTDSWWLSTSGPLETADSLDARALLRTGEAVLGSLATLQTVQKGEEGGDWWAFPWAVFGRRVLLGVGAGALLFNLVLGGRSASWVVRLALTAALGVLILRHPVAALFAFVPLVLLVDLAGVAPLGLAIAPFALLFATGVALARRGELSGLLLAPWEIATAMAGVLLLWLQRILARPGSIGGGRRQSKAKARWRRVG